MYVCFQLKWRVGWELELWNFCQQWWTAKKHRTNNTENVTQNQPLVLKPQQCCENYLGHFPRIPFLSQWKIQLSTGLATMLSLTNVSTPPIFFSFTKLYYSTLVHIYQLSLESLIYWLNLSLFHTGHQISWKKSA